MQPVAFPTAQRLSVTEAAQHLKVSESYLNKLRCTGGGPTFMKFGSRVVYTLSDIDAWANERRRVSTSDTGKQAPNVPV